MMKEKYSKLHTDRISVALAPLMQASKVEGATKSSNWQEETVHETMGINEITVTSTGNSSSPSKESFWETEF